MLPGRVIRRIAQILALECRQVDAPERLDQGADGINPSGSRTLGRNGEAVYTGTGFPRVFYLAYHLYREYFPLLALTTYKRAMEREASA